MIKHKYVAELAAVGFLMVSWAVNVQAEIPALERNALLEFYNNTNGQYWRNNTGWNGPAGTECSWYGITCNASNTAVNWIVMTNNGVNGSLPDSIGHLTRLNSLDLYDNRLSGSIPESLGTLSHLQVLRFESNSLTGTIPASLGNLTALTFLSLESNQLTGTVPNEFGRLINLESLWLSANKLSGSIPKELGQLSKLRILTLGGNQLSGDIPVEFGNLSSLEYLTLESNQLTGSLPESFGNLSELTTLMIENNQLTGPIPSSIGNLTKLSELWLSSNRLTGPIPKELGKLSNLVWLDLTANQLTGSIPPEIGNLFKLEHFFLSQNQLTGSLPAELGNLSEVKVFWINSNKLTGELPANLINMTGLQKGGGHIDYNGLYSTSADPALQTFFNEKFAPSWASTQTVAPDNVVDTGSTDHGIWLNWDPVTYLPAGGYRIYVAREGSGKWALANDLPDKNASVFPVTNLEPNTSYELKITSYTLPYGKIISFTPFKGNFNLVESDASSTVKVKTTNNGCEQPVLHYQWGDEVILTVEGVFDTYLWKTGETVSSIRIVAPESPQWQWVTVTSGACEETAAALLEAPEQVYRDGFESGNTSAWSATSP